MRHPLAFHAECKYFIQAEYPFFAQGTAKNVILSFLFQAVGLYFHYHRVSCTHARLHPWMKINVKSHSKVKRFPSKVRKGVSIS